jgi:hypothetical protein
VKSDLIQTKANSNRSVLERKFSRKSDFKAKEKRLKRLQEERRNLNANEIELHA